MDMEPIYLFSGVLILSCLVLFTLQRLFRSKSYEEVLAEQRQQTSALYSNQPKPKLKDKKLKKALKKQNKEKKVYVRPDGSPRKSQDSGSTSSNEDQDVDATDGSKYHHVEFQESAAIIPENQDVKDPNKRKMSNSVKPILLNRDSSENVYDVVEVPTVNHFEQIHPKDEVELFNSNIHKDEKDKKKVPKGVADKKTKQQVNEEDRQSKPSTVAVEKVEKEQEITKKVVPVVEVKKMPTASTTTTVVSNCQNGVSTAKENNKKKKKSEFNINAQQNFEKVDILNQLVSLVNKTEMSKGDVQTLINVLLNKQQDAPVVDDWSEGKGDPVQKLKKQLAEKEKLVQDLEEMKIGSQTKLREIRLELNSERSQSMQKIRDLEETLKVFKIEMQNKDKQYSAILAQCQQITAKYNEEISNARSTRDEANSFAGKIQELERANDALQQEMNNILAKRSEENHSYIQAKMQIKHLQEESDKREMHFREIKAKYDQNLQDLVQENQNGKRQLEEKTKHHINESRLLKNELQKLQEQLAKYSNDFMQLSEENSKLGYINQGIQHEKQILAEESKQLREELKQLRESQTHGSIEMDKHYKSQISNLNFELTQVKNQLLQSESTNKSNLEEARKKFEADLEEQKSSNDDLRRKNWKVMEALSAAETKLSNYLKESSKTSADLPEIKNLIAKTKEETQSAAKDFLERLFPDISGEISPSLSFEDWQKAVEVQVADEINKKQSVLDNKAKELQKLVEENSNYKNYMEEVEGILLKLQSKIDEEEKRNAIELKSKEECIAQLRQQLAEAKKELESVEISRSSSLSEKSPTEAIVINHATNGACLIAHTSSNSSAASSTVDVTETKKKKKKKKNKNKDN